MFAPKFRRKVAYGALRQDIANILSMLCKRKGVNIVEAEICPDHVHMLVEIPPNISVASFVGYIKGKSTLMIFERNAQPEVFKNIGDGIWWAIITFATVGYGDIYPITFLGKLLGCIICLVGVAMVAIPTGIISSSFINIVQKKEQREKFNKEEENRR